MEHFDVVIVGAGPAGAVAAFALAPLRRVLLVEREAGARERIGKSLAPAARPLLADLGLLGAFEREHHPPCYGNRAAWGSNEPFETDFLRDPNGCGWHLDRARFDVWLRNAAAERGAELMSPAHVTAMHVGNDGWHVSLGDSGSIVARLVIDAGGRSAGVARHLGARRRVHDRLISSWPQGRVASAHIGAGLTYIQADEQGWWYSAPLSNDRRVLAFHADADLIEPDLHDPARLHAFALRRGGELTSMLSACGFVPDGACGVTAAHSAILEPANGIHQDLAWMAAGDAAISFDPLSAQGIFNALYTGFAAARAADAYLSGDTFALTRYREAIGAIHAAYRTHLAHWYAQEQRWPQAPFWRRRHAMQRAAQSAA